jgi:hypothetical protein
MRTEIHWTHSFEDARIDVILLTRLPSQNSALLTVMKHKDSPEEPIAELRTLHIHSYIGQFAIA